MVRVIGRLNGELEPAVMLSVDLTADPIEARRELVTSAAAQVCSCGGEVCSCGLQLSAEDFECPMCDQPYDHCTC